MARQARLDGPGVLHHVMARGLDRQRIFRDDRDREDFLRRVETLAVSGSWVVLAWALIPNHFHLLVQTGNSSLSRTMRSLMSGYAGYFNRRHRRSGHVFQNRFKSVVCEAESYFLELVRYVHLNPLRAGLVGSCAELDTYPYSGHSALLGKMGRPWQAADRVLMEFGSTATVGRREYGRFVHAGATQGRRPELTGGGLLRSQGGWEGVSELRGGRESYRSDERVLGSSDFVTALMEEVEAREGSLRQTVALDDLARRISESYDVSVDAMIGGGRRRRVSEARSVLCWIWSGSLGRSGRELARYLGLSPQAVYAAVRRMERGSEIPQEDLDAWLK